MKTRPEGPTGTLTCRIKTSHAPHGQGRKGTRLTAAADDEIGREAIREGDVIAHEDVAQFIRSLPGYVPKSKR